MRLRTGLVLGLLAGGFAVCGGLVAHELASAKQRAIVVKRFLAGYYDRRGKFVAVAGRGATNVDRNAVLMFVMSGAVDTGPKLKATLPLTIAEQAELADLAQKVADGSATPEEQRRFEELGGDVRAFFEPGVIARKDSDDPNARFVASGSVTSDSVRIVADAGGGEALASGVFFKCTKKGGKRIKVRKFVFNPQYVVATFNRPGEIDYNPEGFEANTRYSIDMQGGSQIVSPLTVVTNLDGLPLAEPFSTSLTTSDRYAQDFTRPEIRETSPNDGSVNVASDADIDLTFSEPMDIDSFQLPRFDGDEAATVNIRYTLSSVNGGLAGRNILAIVRVKPQTAGNVVQIRPLQGFGQGPYEVEVTVTNGVTDLSGNNIIRQQQFVFTTEEDPTAEDFGQIDEVFEDDSKKDTQWFADPANLSGDNVFADWNDGEFEGLLRTAVNEVTFEVVGPNTGGNVNVWFTRAVRWQMLFPSNDMGGRPRTLTGFRWVQTNTQSLLTYPNTQVKIGHANDAVAGGGFQGGTNPPGPVASNYREVPVTVTPSINYTIPVGISLANPPTVPPSPPFLVDGPVWAEDFNFDGRNGVILEVEHFGNGTGPPPPTGNGVTDNWEIDANFSLNAMTFSLFQDVPPIVQAQPWYHRTQFTFLSPGAEARSLWYDVQETSIRWVPQQIIPFSQPQGTSVSIRWQGAKGSVNDPTVLDPTSITPWTSDIRTLAGNPFVRWQVELSNNLATGNSATIDTLIIPYTFR
jgi:hypothetical protein